MFTYSVSSFNSSCLRRKFDINICQVFYIVDNFEIKSDGEVFIS